MVFEYEVPTRAYFSTETDEYFYDTELVVYTPGDTELLEEIARLIKKDLKSSLDIKEVEKYIKDRSLLDVLCDEYHDELYEAFEGRARKENGK